MSDEMEMMQAAYTELVEDTTTLWDQDFDGEPYSAVAVSLDRVGSGWFEINVRLRQIEGAQLAFVLAVARKYELEAREENGYLMLSRHLTSGDAESDPESAEAAAS